MSDKKDTGGFLNRWSALKQQAVRPAPSDCRSPAATPASGISADGTASLTDRQLPGERGAGNPLTTVQSAATGEAPGRNTLAKNSDPACVEEAVHWLTDADMPAIESLTASSDISGFFSKGVSAALRKSALRHVFRQPVYNVRDGLDDYDDDYTSFAPLGDTVTADMKFHVARKERARLEAEAVAKELELSEREASVVTESVAPEPSSCATGSATEPEEVETVDAQDATRDHDSESLQPGPPSPTNDSPVQTDPARIHPADAEPVSRINPNTLARSTVSQNRETSND